MNDSGYKGISYSAAFFITICFTIAALIFALMLTRALWPFLSSQTIVPFEKGMYDPRFTNAARISQSILAVVGFLLPAFVTASFINRYPVKLLGFTPSTFTFKQLGLTIGIMLFALAVSSSLGYLSHQLPLPDSWDKYFTELEQAYNNQVENIIGLSNFDQLLISLFVMAFLPALCEEVLFRGALQNFLTRGTHKPWLSIVIVSLIFSLAHFSAYGFLSRMFLGVLLGAIYHYSGRLWLAILAHFINNAIALSALYYYKHSGKDLSAVLNERDGNYWGLLAIPAVIILIILLQKAKPAAVTTA